VNDALSDPPVPRRDVASSGETKTPEPLPWPMTAATLLAFAAFILNRRQTAGAALMAVSIAASLFVAARMRRTSWTNWIVRAVLYGLVLTILLAEPVAGAGPASTAALYVDALMQLCMAELVVQYWQWPRTGGRRSALIALLSSFLVVAASKTYESRVFPYLAPVYAMCLVFALRATRARLSSAAEGWRGLISSRGALALLVALVLGLCGAGLIKAYGRNLVAPETDFARALQAAQQAVGFTGAPRLGSSQNVARSLTRVLRLDCAVSADATAPSRPLHLRGVAYDTYVKGRWEPVLGARRYIAVGPEVLRGPGRGPRVRIARLTEETPLLFVPLHCAGIGVAPEERERPVALQLETGHGGAVTAAGDSPFDYDVEMGTPEYQRGPVCRPPKPDECARCLEVPADISPAVQTLAEQVAGRLLDPRARVAAIENYLRANHEYSLTAVMGRGDPVSEFLLRKKAAHCEYFASAAVILLRCVDVPARFVTGFYAHERAGSTAVTVRQQDAHAWAEAWIDGAGWITVDATPPAGRPDQLSDQPSWWRRASERVVDALGALWRRPGLRAGVVAAIVAVLGFLYWRYQRRGRRKGEQQSVRAYTLPAPPLVAVTERFEKLLRRRSIPCPPQLTWGEHLALLSGSSAGREVRGIDFAHAMKFLEEYNAVRFGWTDATDRVAQVIAALEAAERSA